MSQVNRIFFIHGALGIVTALIMTNIFGAFWSFRYPTSEAVVVAVMVGFMGSAISRAYRAGQNSTKAETAKP
jgi:hypothetical protein